MSRNQPHSTQQNGHATDDTRLEPNEAEVASKVYDDEVILMHLSTGVYGSSENLGALVWQAIEARCSVREMADLFAAHCEVAPDHALADARELATQLLQEKMVQRSSATVSQPVNGAADRLPYRRPTLVVYRDMEDLLALDPPLPQYAEAPWKKE